MSPSKPVKSFLRTAVLFCVFLSAVWLSVWLAWRACPQVEPGSLRVYEAKMDAIRRGQVFSPGARTRVLVVGDSRALVGFRPDLFEQLSGGKVEAYNCGLVLTLFYHKKYTLLDILKSLESSRQLPTHLLLTNTCPFQPSTAVASQPTFAVPRPLQLDTDATVKRLFPFRQFPRNLLAFLRHSRRNGGLRGYARLCEDEVATMLRQKGYYYLRTLSANATGTLPKDYRARGDDPARPVVRTVDLASAELREVTRLAEATGMKVILAPTYFRQGACARPGAPTVEERRLAARGVESCGPAYWLFPSECFSDSVHVNAAGSEIYTRALWQALGAHLSNGGPVTAAP